MLTLQLGDGSVRREKASTVWLGIARVGRGARLWRKQVREFHADSRQDSGRIATGLARDQPGFAVTLADAKACTSVIMGRAASRLTRAGFLRIG